MTPEAELTDDMIAAAMAKADARVSVGSDRCFAFPTCSRRLVRAARRRGAARSAGTRRVIVGRGRRESRDVWLEVSTGLVTLIAQVDA